MKTLARTLAALVALSLSGCTLTLGGDSWFKATTFQSTTSTQFGEGDTSFTRAISVAPFSIMGKEEAAMGYKWKVDPDGNWLFGDVTVGSSAEGIDQTGQIEGMAALIAAGVAAGMALPK